MMRSGPSRDVRRVRRSRPLNSLLHTAVLSLLVERPGHVYNLALRYDDRFGDRMPRVAATIYRVVDALEKKGLAEGMQPPPSDTKHKTYRATAEGTNAFTVSLTEEIRGEPLRLELVMRMLSAAAAGGSEPVLQVLDAFERECLEEATRLPPTPSAADNLVGVDDMVAVVEQLVAEERRLAIGVHLRWIRFARAQIRRLSAAGETDGVAGT